MHRPFLWDLNTSQIGTQTASFVFIKNVPLYEHERPYVYTGPLPKEKEHLRSNLVYQRQDNVPIRDLRPRMHNLSLAEHGIQFLKCTSDHLDDLFDEGERDALLQETIKAIDDVLGAELVLMYTIRVSNACYLHLAFLRELIKLYSSDAATQRAMRWIQWHQRRPPWALLIVLTSPYGLYT